MGSSHGRATVFHVLQLLLFMSE